MFFLDDIGPGFGSGNGGTIVNPIIIVILSVIVIVTVSVTAILIKKGKK